MDIFNYHAALNSGWNKSDSDWVPHSSRKTGLLLPLILVMRRRHRGHFDFWADFHTDNAAMFAFLEKSLRRLVNALIKAGTTGAAASFFA